jgi:hypothetical protein
MSKKKSALVLGYTRNGYVVTSPTKPKPEMDHFTKWEPADHLDASRILFEHAERAGEPIGPLCDRWADAHAELGESAKKKEKEKERERRARRIQIQVRGSVETTILSRRRG